jgi:hypothetical protein
MDAQTIILLTKIVTDLVMTITMSIPKVSGMTKEEKEAMLLSLQENSSRLMGTLYMMGTQK